MKHLRLVARFDLALRFSECVAGKELGLEVLVDPEAGPIMQELIDLSEEPESRFDDDLMLQISVALSTLNYYCGSLFTRPVRMALGSSLHPAVRKALRAPQGTEGDKIAPYVSKYWFLFRPVAAKVCTYREMFIEEVFDFDNIHEMHEMLDLEQYGEIIASHTET